VWGRVSDPSGRYKSLRLGFKQLEENELRFEVNGQMFFVNFVPEEGRWYCYAPTATGMQRIPVSMDSAPFEAFAVPVDEQVKEVVN
jgi:hypothetical protein